MATAPQDTQEKQIRDVCEQLRERLQEDGGDLEVVSIVGPKVQVRLKGACGCCPHAMLTLKNGVERILREQVSKQIEVERVE
ncbi:MAG: Fe/S biogenesis protein NfuA [Lentisphaerae bacterium ADurb.BinA184]|nr:MAG: Fe/S biogenesis protein NfuA [Lentisphaerae bacterium ADurb.BinA184]